jgi:anti-sigma factor RsiW
MRHVDEGQLHAYLDGVADDVEAGLTDRLDAHFAQCDTCRARLAAARRVREQAHSLLARVSPANVHAPPFGSLGSNRAGEWNLPLWRVRLSRRANAIGWAASLVLAAGLGWLAAGFRAEQLAERSAELERSAAAGADLRTASASPLAAAGSTPEPHPCAAGTLSITRAAQGVALVVLPLADSVALDGGAAAVAVGQRAIVRQAEPGAVERSRIGRGAVVLAFGHDAPVCPGGDPSGGWMRLRPGVPAFVVATPRENEPGVYDVHPDRVYTGTPDGYGGNGASPLLDPFAYFELYRVLPAPGPDGPPTSGFAPLWRWERENAPLSRLAPARQLISEARRHLRERTGNGS